MKEGLKQFYGGSNAKTLLAANMNKNTAWPKNTLHLLQNFRFSRFTQEKVGGLKRYFSDIIRFVPENV